MIIPAIDLIEGGVVRLKKGDFDDKILYEDDPVSLAHKYADAGVEWIHVVDLSGAKDPANRQLRLLQKIASSTSCKLQVGGGVRTIDDVRELVRIGIARVVIGSIAIESPETVISWTRELPPGTCLPAIDVKPDMEGNYEPVIRGWTQPGTNRLNDILDKFAEAGIEQVLTTDVSRDGMMTGPNISLYNRLYDEHPGLKYQASGGVSSLDDIRELGNSNAISGVIVGRALLDGTFNIDEAMGCWQNG